MGAITVRNLEALVKLGVKLVERAVATPFAKAVSAEDVIAIYKDDRIAAVTEHERLAAPRVRRCTGCGVCDRLADSGPAPSLLVLRLGREGQDAPAVNDAVRRLQPIAEAIRDACPERVDVPALLAAIVRRR